MRSPFKLILALGALAIGASAALAILPHPVAPDVRFATLSGEILATSDLRGKVVLVNFWSTLCAECLAEIPRLTETYRSCAPRGCEVVAVAMHHDSLLRVADFTFRQGLPFKVAFDESGEIATSFGSIRVTPTIFILDKQGRILKHYVGELNWRELRALLDQALQ